MKAQDMFPRDYFKKCKESIEKNLGRVLYYTDAYEVNNYRALSAYVEGFDSDNVYERFLSCFTRVRYETSVCYGIFKSNMLKEVFQEIPTITKRGYLLFPCIADENLLARYLVKGRAFYIADTFRYKIDHYRDADNFVRYLRYAKSMDSLVGTLSLFNLAKLYKAVIDMAKDLPHKPDDWRDELKKAIGFRYDCKILWAFPHALFMKSIFEHFFRKYLEK
jgi:hypothetical protein